MKRLLLFLLASAFLFAQTTVTYRCSGGDSFQVSYTTDHAVIRMEGKPVLRLPQVRSGSGIRYSDGYTTLLSKGPLATILSGAVNVQDCRGGAAFAGKWRVTAIYGEEVQSVRPVTVEFLDGSSRVTGFAGCNRFSGSYTETGESLKLGPIAATKMACAGPGMATESRFLKALSAVAGHRMEGETLELTAADGTVLIRLVR